MSKAEVENLSDEDLKKAWEEIKAAIRMGVGQYLSYHQGNVLFADFVNVSSEMTKRKLEK